MPYEKHGKIMHFHAFCYWKRIKKAIPPKQTKNNNNKRPWQNPRKKYKRHQLFSLSELSIFLSYAKLQRDRKEGRKGGRKEAQLIKTQGESPRAGESFPVLGPWVWRVFSKLTKRQIINKTKQNNPPNRNHDEKPWQYHQPLMPAEI